jgi:hypothetical protein
VGLHRPRSVVAWVGVVAGLTVLVAGLMAVALLVWRDRSGADADGVVRLATASATEASDRADRAPTGPSVPPGEQAEPVVDRGADLHAAACQGTLELVSVSAPVADAGLVEVSGVAVAADGAAWVVNDSGDSARVFGLRPVEGGTLAVQTVTVTGAENVDWEDVAIGPGPTGPVLWLADTGDNLGVRPAVTLYRVPVPAPDATAVAAEAVTVAYPDGPHDVEAVVAEPDGAVVLLTKEPGRSRAYRVAPDGSGRVRPVSVAEAVGEFAVGDGTTSVLTAADLSADGSTVVLRTYGSVFVVTEPEERSWPEALADPALRCRALPPMELQGESVGLLPDAGGYVSVGEGTGPYLTTVVAPDP